MNHLRSYLEKTEDPFFDRWVSATAKAGIQYPGIITEDILGDGGELYRQLTRVLARPRYHLGPRKRINPIGKRIGERRAMTGVSLEAVLELFIIFRHELWDHLSPELSSLSEQELLEVRRRIDLYLDQLIASIAYAYTSTKEKAMVGLIEKLLS